MQTEKTAEETKKVQGTNEPKGGKSTPILDDGTRGDGNDSNEKEEKEKKKSAKIDKISFDKPMETDSENTEDKKEPIAINKSESISDARKRLSGESEKKSEEPKKKRKYTRRKKKEPEQALVVSGEDALEIIDATFSRLAKLIADSTPGKKNPEIPMEYWKLTEAEKSSLAPIAEKVSKIIVQESDPLKLLSYSLLFSYGMRIVQIKL